MIEETFTFACEGQQLVAVLHRPARPRTRRGVLIVVGGPQYRVGSHRQFTLLARHLAGEGIVAMRFDYRGMGDSEGEERSFERIDADIGAAISALLERVPELDSVVVWGLCDAASAALLLAPHDMRIGGLVLVNPWVRSESGAAKAYLKHYYLQRLASREFWSRLLGGKLNLRESLGSLLDMLRKAVRKGAGEGPRENADRPFQARMREGLAAFEKPVMLVLSGNQDYVADEFRDLVSGSKEWQKFLARSTVTRHAFEEANHTFSRREWRDRLAGWTVDWVRGLDAADR